MWRSHFAEWARSLRDDPVRMLLIDMDEPGRLASPPPGFLEVRQMHALAGAGNDVGIATDAPRGGEKRSQVTWRDARTFPHRGRRRASWR